VLLVDCPLDVDVSRMAGDDYATVSFSIALIWRGVLTPSLTVDLYLTDLSSGITDRRGVIYSTTIIELSVTNSTRVAVKVPLPSRLCIDVRCLLGSERVARKPLYIVGDNDGHVRFEDVHSFRRA
jgi:hypothetical protein